MTPEKEKRLEELQNKFELVHKGTGKVIGHEGPGGAPIIDDDIKLWKGTEDESREYSELWREKCVEQYNHEAMESLKIITDALYGGK